MNNYVMEYSFFTNLNRSTFFSLKLSGIILLTNLNLLNRINYEF